MRCLLADLEGSNERKKTGTGQGTATLSLQASAVCRSYRGPGLNLIRASISSVGPFLAADGTGPASARRALGYAACP